MGVNLEIRYPMPSDLAEHGFANIADVNEYVDAILQCVYDHAHAANLAASKDQDDMPSRSLFFSSFNPSICTALNWKQPNCKYNTERHRFSSPVYTNAAFPASRCRVLQQLLWRQKATDKAWW